MRIRLFAVVAAFSAIFALSAVPAYADHVASHDEVARGGVKALDERVWNLETLRLPGIDALLISLETRIDVLGDGGGGGGEGPSVVSVDCGMGQTIADALALATPGTPLTVSFFGTCIEDVSIDRDDITLAGLDPNDHSLSIIQGGVTVTGVQRVIIENATVTDSANRGVTVIQGAAARLQNLTITNNVRGGVLVSRSSWALLEKLTITNNSDHGVFVNRNSYAEILDTNIINNARTGLQAGRGSHFDVRNSNITLSGNLDLSMLNGARGQIGDSNIGPHAATSTRGQNIGIRDSNLELRDVAVIGNVRVNVANLRLIDSAITGDVILINHAVLSGTAFVNATSSKITGNVQLSRGSLLTHEGTRLNPFTVTGNVTCSTSQSGLGVNAGDANPGGLGDGEGLEILGTVDSKCTLMDRLID